MTTPGFTAELSLSTLKDTYVPTSKAAAGTGSVLPQGTIIRQTGDGFDIIHCYDEGGFSGCWTQHIHIPTLF